MKVSMLVNGYEAASRHLQSTSSFEVGCALSALKSELQDVYEKYVKENNDLISKYGRDPDPNNPEEKGLNGKFVPVEPRDKYLEFLKERDELLNKVVNVRYTTLVKSDFTSEKISGYLVEALFPFFSPYKDEALEKKS